jgi:hypothetical protein
VAAAKLAGSWVQPCSMQTSGTGVCGSMPTGECTTARLVCPATIEVRSSRAPGRSGARTEGGRALGAPRARSIAARLDA